MNFRYYILIPLIILCSMGGLFAQNPDQAIPGELIVMLSSEEDLDRLVYFTRERPEFELKEQLSKRLNIYLLSYDIHTIKGSEAIAELSKQPFIAAVQYNHKVQLRATIPNDLDTVQQWNLGSSPGGIHATSAWDSLQGGVTADGDTIVVAVIDNRFDLDHEDLNFFRNHNDIPGNSIDDDLNGYIDDHYGWNAYDNEGITPGPGLLHATHVAGIAGAVSNNNTGIAGVGWNLKILAVEGSSTQEATVIKSYDYVLEMRALHDATNGAKGAFIVATNSSFGVDFGQPADFPIWCAFYDSLGAYGILNVGAVINSAEDIDEVGDIPTSCSSDYLVTVTNTLINGKLNSGSGYGKRTVDLGAPGTGIYSTTANDGYINFSGTSMAAAHISGAIGLLFSVPCQAFIDSYKFNPASTALSIKGHLLNTVNAESSLDEVTVSGGRLNIYKAAIRLINDYCVTCMDVDFAVDDIECYGETGDITANVITGSAPYSYIWTNGATTNQLSDLQEGLYSLSITDNAGCAKYFDVRLTEPLALTVSNVTIEPDSGFVKGSISFEIEGGTPPFTFQWDRASVPDSAAIDDLDAGTYTVTATDAEGCQLVEVFSVPNATSVTEVHNQQPVSIYPNPNDGSFIISWELSNQPEGAGFFLYNSLGEVIYHTPVVKPSGKRHINLSYLEQGIYFLRFQKPENDQFAMQKVIILR